MPTTLREGNKYNKFNIAKAIVFIVLIVFFFFYYVSGSC